MNKSESTTTADEKKMLVDGEGGIWDKVETYGCFVSGDGGGASWELSDRTIKDDDALIAGGCEVIKTEYPATANTRDIPGADNE